jgi:hypothetical protein
MGCDLDQILLGFLEQLGKTGVFLAGVVGVVDLLLLFGGEVCDLESADGIGSSTRQKRALGTSEYLVQISFTLGDRSKIVCRS